MEGISKWKIFTNNYNKIPSLSAFHSTYYHLFLEEKAKNFGVESPNGFFAQLEKEISKLDYTPDEKELETIYKRYYALYNTGEDSGYDSRFCLFLRQSLG